MKTLRCYQICPRVLTDSEPVEVFGGFMHLCVKDCLKKDVKKGNNVNELDDNGRTALHYLSYFESDCEPYGMRGHLIAKLIK